ncbi:HNH endonuclease [Chitinibacter tainanensis]|uniref:HNH endonuclease n=1 Tax=Chitinibacter tainanensis TaxID=230667 RepID=UPI00048E8519|nr:HNH endonuclease signature motif containing protein [Chitinibacter tainanensis]
MAVDAATRAAVLFGWAYKCFYCGHDACLVDHIVPIEKDGTDEPHNLVASCKECNNMKSDLWLPLSALEEALASAAVLTPFVLEAADIYRKSILVARDRLAYGSLQLKEGDKGQSLLSPGVRRIPAARVIAVEAAEIAERYKAKKQPQKKA